MESIWNLNEFCTDPCGIFMESKWNLREISMASPMEFVCNLLGFQIESMCRLRGTLRILMQLPHDLYAIYIEH